MRIRRSVAPISTPALPASAAQALRSACAKGQSLAWVALAHSQSHPPERHHLVWVGWQGQRALIVVGDGEQQVPGLVEAAQHQRSVMLCVRASDTKARVASWPCLAQILEPGSDDWREAAAVLAPLRLNGPVAAAGLAAVWREHATLLALDPLASPVPAEQENLLEHPALGGVASTVPTGPLDQPPVPTPATTG